VTLASRGQGSHPFSPGRFKSPTAGPALRAYLTLRWR